MLVGADVAGGGGGGGGEGATGFGDGALRGAGGVGEEFICSLLMSGVPPL